MLSANAAAPRTRPRICIPRPVIEPSCPDRRCGLDLIGTPNGRKRKALVRVNAPHAAPVVQLCGKPDQRSPERHQALSSEGGMSDRAKQTPWSSLGGRRCQNGGARSFSLFRNTCGFRAAAAPLTLTKRMLSASTPAIGAKHRRSRLRKRNGRRLGGSDIRNCNSHRRGCCSFRSSQSCCVRGSARSGMSRSRRCDGRASGSGRSSVRTRRRRGGVCRLVVDL